MRTRLNHGAENHAAATEKEIVSSLAKGESLETVVAYTLSAKHASVSHRRLSTRPSLYGSHLAALQAVCSCS